MHRGPEQGRKCESYASTIYNTNYSRRAKKNYEAQLQTRRRNRVDRAQIKYYA